MQDGILIPRRRLSCWLLYNVSFLTSSPAWSPGNCLSTGSCVVTQIPQVNDHPSALLNFGRGETFSSSSLPRTQSTRRISANTARQSIFANSGYLLSLTFGQSRWGLFDRCCSNSAATKMISRFTAFVASFTEALNWFVKCQARLLIQSTKVIKNFLRTFSTYKIKVHLWKTFEEYFPKSFGVHLPKTFGEHFPKNFWGMLSLYHYSTVTFISHLAIEFSKTKENPEAWKWQDLNVGRLP